MLKKRGFALITRLVTLFFIPAVCIAMVLASGCGKSAPAGPQGFPPAVVTTAPVALRDVPDYLDEIGKTTAEEVVTITPQVSGKITDRLFTDGADLQEKQILFKIDSRPYDATLAAADAALQQSQAQLAYAQTEFNRMQSLLATKAVAQQDYDDKKNAVDVAAANVKASEAQLESARLNVEYCTITSPIAGRAGARLVDAGNIVTANTTSLLVIEKIAPIYVDFTVNEDDLPRVRQNMANGALKVQVTSPDDPAMVEDGELTFLDNAVQDGSGTIKLRATVKNDDHRLWPGQFVRVRLILKVIKDAILIPNEAVQIGQQGTFVFVAGPPPPALPAANMPAPSGAPGGPGMPVPNATAMQKPVKVGQRQGNDVVIEEGLVPTDVVVKSGQLMLFPTSPMIVVNPPPAGAAGMPPGAAEQKNATALQGSTAQISSTSPAAALDAATTPPNPDRQITGGATGGSAPAPTDAAAPSPTTNPAGVPK
jgi:multidrug efflux system membrane fusion protein